MPKQTLAPKVQADQKLQQNFPRTNRTMTVVYVGNTGGHSLFQVNSYLHCARKYVNDPTQVQTCLQQERIPDSFTPLAKQAQHFFHLGQGRPENVQATSSFLFTLRNPVDRILATYQDSHPLACTSDNPPRPWGCTTKASF